VLADLLSEALMFVKIGRPRSVPIHFTYYPPEKQSTPRVQINKRVLS